MNDSYRRWIRFPQGAFCLVVAVLPAQDCGNLTTDWRDPGYGAGIRIHNGRDVGAIQSIRPSYSVHMNVIGKVMRLPGGHFVSTMRMAFTAY